MRLTVIHDSNGTIMALVAYPAGAPPAYPEIRPGQHIIEIEAPPEITLDLDARQIRERLSDLMQNYRLEVEAVKCGLAKKP